MCAIKKCKSFADSFHVDEVLNLAFPAVCRK